MAKKNIVILLPESRGQVSALHMRSYIGSKNYLEREKHNLPFEVDIFEYCSTQFPADASRNESVGLILENFKQVGKDIRVDTSLWFDSDVMLQPDTIYRLIESQEPVVSGMIFNREFQIYHDGQLGIMPLCYKRYEYDEQVDRYTYMPYYNLGETFQVDMVGMGCVKIDREVYDCLDAPYFAYQEYFKAMNHPDGEFMMRHKVKSQSEEEVFWRRIVDAGWKIVVDPNIQCGHIKTEIISVNQFTKQDLSKFTVINHDNNHVESERQAADKPNG